jgi:hypothetical protein
VSKGARTRMLCTTSIFNNDVVMFAASMGLHLQRIQEIHAQLASYPKKLTIGLKKSGVRMESECTL